MALVLDWQKKLGYRKDPFVDKPTHDLVGLPLIRQKINLFLLKNQKLALIDGDTGMGKSSFVLWLKRELRGKRRIREVVLKEVPGDKLEAHLIRLTEELYKKIPFFDKLYEQMTNVQRTKELEHKELVARLKKEALLLVIEDANKLSKAHATLLNELLEQTKLEIILLDTKVKNPFSMKHGLKVSLRKYTDADLTTLLQRRIEGVGSVGTFPFDNKELKKLFKKAEGNPRKLLAAARDRAVDLSLKGLPLPEKPKPEPKEVVEKPKKKTSKGKKFNFLGNIKVEVVDESKRPPQAPKKQVKKEHSKEEHELSEETLEDAELLKKMVEEGLGEKHG